MEYKKVGGEIVDERRFTAKDGSKIRVVAVKNANIMRNANIKNGIHGKIDEKSVHEVNFIKIGNEFTLIH